jgi:sulfoxide reductase heme-binding subunit YedZ
MAPRSRIDTKTTARLLRIGAHIGALLPLALLVWDYWTFQLSADPIREATLRTGKAALTLLVLSLACTPLNIIFGWKQFVPLRRTLGLYAFMYATLHGLIFVGIDYAFDLELILEAILRKPYAIAGLSAFLIMVPLALTSNRWSLRKLGKKWKLLHRLAYLAAIVAVVHFLWLVKQAYTRPLIYATVLAVLLAIRVRPVKERIVRRRTESKKQVVSRPPSSIQ